MKRAGRSQALWTDAPLVDEEEIFSELHVKQGSSLFLGRYSLAEVLAVDDGVLRPAHADLR